jgi:hypothetical protein
VKFRLQILLILLGLSFCTSYAQKSFGLGIILGEPTGLSAKLWTGSSNAFDFGAAWSFEGSGHLLLQADYVWHSSLTKASSGQLALYYGIGGRIVFANDPDVGVRIPIGLDYIFSSAPIDIFAEVVPIMDLIPDTEFVLNGGLGIRFWL